jgi:hypothetical protein
MRLTTALALLVATLAPATRVLAQGNGHAYGLYKNPHPGGSSAASTASGPSAAGAPEIQLPGTGIRNFGSWLDDATVMAPGNAYFSVGFGYWKMAGFREFDVPTVDGGVAVNRRVQVGVSVPYYRANEPGGPVAAGFGTVYLSTKVQLKDAASHRVGFAVTPALEILSASPGNGQGRVSWALPVSVEVQRTGWRTYGSAGYFSRGALFAAGAVEKSITERTSLTGSISHSHSMDPDPLSVALGLAQTRTDVAGGATVFATPKVAVYGSVGRTISKQDSNSASLMITGGVSMSFTR